METRLLRRALDEGALDELPALRALTHGAAAGEAECVILEVAATEAVADRRALSVNLLHRLARTLRDDVTYLELPDTKALDVQSRVDRLVTPAARRGSSRAR